MERLIGITDVCEVLGISRDSFYKHEAALKADGMAEVKVAGSRSRKFLASSLDSMLRKAAHDGTPIGVRA